MALLDTIAALAQLRGCSGFEGDVAAVMRDELERTGARVTVDAMGNVVARVGRGEQNRTVMVCVHTDEVGLVVRHIDDAGYLWFDTNGMVNVAALPGTPVDICTAAGIVPGVVMARSRHLLTAEELARVPEVDDLWIEVGAASAAAVRRLGIEVGDGVVFQPNFRTLANGYVMGKSLDNRIGCAILLHLAEALQAQALDYGLLLVACVQEEVGSRGAAVVAQTWQPDMALVLDTVPAGDPMTPVRRAPVAVGGGPVIRVLDTLPTFLGTLYAPRIRRRLAATAAHLQLPHQFDTARTWTDAATIHTAGRGVPSGGLFIPRRGSHSPVEVASLADAEATLRLALAFLTELDAAAIGALLAPPGG